MPNGDVDQAIAAGPQTLQPSTPAAAPPSMQQDQQKHTVMQAFGRYLTSLLPGVAEQRHKEALLAAHQQENFNRIVIHGAITQAQKGNPEVLENPAVTKAFKSAYGPELGPQAQQWLYGTGKHIQQEYGPWNNLKLKYRGDPIAAYNDPNAQGMPIPKQDKAVIDAQFKAGATATGKLTAEQQVYQRFDAIMNAFPDDPKTAVEIARSKGIPIRPEVERQVVGATVAPEKERLTRPEKITTDVQREEALRGPKAATAGAVTAARDVAHQPALEAQEKRRFKTWMREFAIKEDAAAMKRVRDEQAKFRLQGSKPLPTALAKSIEVHDADGNLVDSAALTFDQLEQIKKGGGWVTGAGWMKQHGFGGGGAQPPATRSPEQMRTEDEQYNQFMLSHGRTP